MVSNISFLMGPSWDNVCAGALGWGRLSLIRNEFVLFPCVACSVLFSGYRRLIPHTSGYDQYTGIHVAFIVYIASMVWWFLGQLL